jgi:hypothetical protein
VLASFTPVILDRAVGEIAPKDISQGEGWTTRAD